MLAEWLDKGQWGHTMGSFQKCAFDISRCEVAELAWVS